MAAPKPTPQKKHSPKDDNSPQTELVNAVSELRNHSRQQITEWLVKNSMLKTATSLVSDGKLKLAEEETIESFTVKKALEIEHYVYMKHFDGGQLTDEYRKQMKSINFNLKTNTSLTVDILTGKVTGEKVSQMSTEEMARKEIQEFNEQARLESEKQHTILTEQQGPRIRRTHKGEELVEDVSTSHSTTVNTAPTVVHHRRPITEDPEILEDAPALKPDPPFTSTPSKTPPTTTSASHTPRASSPAPDAHTKEPRKSFDINAVWSKVETTTTSDAPTRPSSTPQPFRPTHSGVKEDHDVDMLLRDDAPQHNDTGTPPYSPQLHPTSLPSLPSQPHWKGHITMSGIASLTCYATHLGGPSSVGSKPWPDLLDANFAIDGRIKVERATEYLCGQKFSRSSALITALLQPEGERDREEFGRLWEYFDRKERYAVVGRHTGRWVKDLYLVPVEKGRGELPVWFEVLEPAVDSSKLPEGRALLIVTVVIRGQVESQQLQPTQQFQTPMHQQQQWPPHLQPQATPSNYGTPLQPVATPYTHPTPAPAPPQPQFAPQQPLPQQPQFQQQLPPPPPQPQMGGVGQGQGGYAPKHPMTRELISMVPGLGEVQIRAIDSLLQQNPELQNKPDLLAEEVGKVLGQGEGAGGQ